MRRLIWSEEAGNVCWWGDAKTWVGAWERRQQRQGIYVSARQSMVAFVLDGELAVELGPRRLSTRVGSGGALVVHARTPFAYRMSAGTRVLLTETSGLDEHALGIRFVAPGQIGRHSAAVLARAWDRPELLAGLSDLGSELAHSSAGSVLPFEPIFNTRRLLAVKRHLDEHFREPLRLREIARRFQMSHFYLSRTFTLTTGVAPKLYLSALRREHFLRSLLARGKKSSLTELALDSGFDDYAAFCRWLRSQLGRAPSQLLDESSTIDQLSTSRSRVSGASLGA